MSSRPRQMERAPRLPPPPARPFALPRPIRFRLDNALEVVLVRGGHDLPLVHVSLALRSGHAADGARDPGVAFVTAALVDEGAGRRSALEITRDLQALGTALHISVDADSTTLALDVLQGELEPALEIIADVVLRPHLAARELERVRGELISRAEDRRADPSQVAGLALAAAVFGDAPHGRPALPRPAVTAAIRREQVARFHRDHYRPDNAVLLVAGAVERSALERMVRSRLGRWRPGGRRVSGGARPPARGPRLVLVPRRDAAESVLRVGRLLPPRRALDPEAVDLLNTILGGSFTSRLNLNLRERHGFTYGAGSSCSLTRGNGLLSVATQVERGATSPALREILNELRKLTRRRVGRAELAKARSLVLEELPSSAETLAGLADEYLELALYREPLSRLNRLPLRLREVTPEALLALARRLLSPEDATLVVVGDQDRLIDELQRAYGPAQLRDVDGNLL